MNAADARDALANGDAADQQAALGWMEQHTEMHMTDHIGDANGMMPTPRTDAVVFANHRMANGEYWFVCHAEFARQLERELANAESCGAAAVDAFRLASTLADIRQAHLDAMKAELAAMRERAALAEDARDFACRMSAAVLERAEKAEKELALAQSAINGMRKEVERADRAVEVMRERAEKAEAERDEARACLRECRQVVLDNLPCECNETPCDKCHFVKRIDSALGEVAR